MKFKKPIAIIPFGKKHYPIFSLEDLSNVYVSKDGKLVNKQFLSVDDRIDFDNQLLEEKFKKGVI